MQFCNLWSKWFNVQKAGNDAVIQLDGATGKEALLEFLINGVSKGFLKSDSSGNLSVTEDFEAEKDFKIGSNLFLSKNTLDTGSDATITLPDGIVIELTGNTHSITSISASGNTNRFVILYVDVGAPITLTFVDGSNLILAGNFAMGGGGDNMILWCDGTNWFELSRSNV